MSVFNLILISLALIAIIFAAPGIKLFFSPGAEIIYTGCCNTNGDSTCACGNAKSCAVDDENQFTG